MSRSTCGRRACDHCGRPTSSNGFGRTAHLRKHVREGILVEMVQRYDAQYGRSMRTYENRVFVLPRQLNDYLRRGWTKREV